MTSPPAATPLHLLTVDLGATNARLALWRGAELVRRDRLPTAGLDLSRALMELAGGREVAGACVAAAGPVDPGPDGRGRVRLTNVGFEVVAAHLAARLGLPVRVVNDFHAAARGVPELSSEGWRLLDGPAPSPGVAVVLGPGTGLGQALLVPVGAGYTVVPGEGGHADLAPLTEDDVQLWRDLRRERGRVCWEDVLSGPGLVALAEAWRCKGQDGPRWSTPAQVTGSSAASALAAERTFARLLGSLAANLALQTLPAGGVWLCGGVLDALEPRLDRAALLEGWRSKGRLGPRVAATPLVRVTDGLLADRGARALAAEVVGG